MNSYKSLIFIGLLSAVLVLSACDHRTRHRKIIVNNSDYDLLIFPGGAEGSVGDSVFIGRHSEGTIFDSNRYGNVKTYKSCYISNTPIPSKIVGHDSLHLTIDLSNKANWVFHVVKREINGGGECECRLQVANVHIQ